MSIKNKWVKPGTDYNYAEGVKVLNDTSTIITTGTVVYVSGFSGPFLKVTTADAAAAATCTGRLMIAKHDLPADGYGVCLPWRLVTAVDTSSYSVGDPVYLQDGGGIGTGAGTISVVLGNVVSSDATTGAWVYASESGGIGSAPLTGLGAVNGATVVAAESGDGVVKVVLTLTATPVVITDDTGTSHYGGVKVYDMPEGVIHWMGATANLTLGLSNEDDGIIATWDGDFALGTAAAAAGATLASTEQDLLPTTATPQAVAYATTATGQSTATEVGAVFDGTTTPVDVYLNFLVDDSDADIDGQGACSILATGTITFFYANLGDY